MVISENFRIIQHKNNVSAVKPFSPPPLCALDQRNLIHKGDPVIVVKEGHVNIKGTLHSEKLSIEYLLLYVEGQKEPLQVEPTFVFK